MVAIMNRISCCRPLAGGAPGVPARPPRSMASGTFVQKLLERHPHPKLRRERNSNRGARAKEIS
jgi:hypothetical protein